MARVNLAQAMKLTVTPVQELKRHAQRRPDGETTMFPTLIALRDDRVICSVTAPRMEPLLACAPTLAIGLDPQMLVIAAQVQVAASDDDSDEAAAQEGIAYTTMTREREAAFALQRYIAQGTEVRFAAPTPGSPQDRSLMEHLAAAMTQAPLDPARVARTEDVPDEQAVAAGALPTFLESADGRLALDAGTVGAARSKVEGVHGTVLYIAASPAQATRLLGYGMPQDALLGD